ncbi:FAD-binding protein [Mesosutterella sp. OilRF-GAM-744-9]|uniref:FAD-binding protein n=2 Tax=Mesosutterella TaxID=2494213 RepID=A0ABS9MT30_9BURK|nr:MULTISPECIES: FAD-dependent oxidoreductase [unclassified Mesosutterella]MCG5031783.1 FAD-binding protein [Mesosutterella sp. oilRF-744-WT-GAM-9]MDL2058484.1 FAD-binding protein [Mesosutterella sp. AGMB02718]
MTQLSRRSILKAGAAGIALSAVPGLTFAKVKARPAKAETYDALIIGAGAAGLVAAISAIDSGAKKVAVIEQKDRPDGNAIYALGSVCGWGSKRQIKQGIKDTEEDFYKAMMAVSNGRADPDLTRTYAKEIPAGLDWLADVVGIEFRPVKKAPYPREYRVNSINGKGITGGSQMVQMLLKLAKSKGVVFLWENRALELLTDNRLRVIGVKTMTPEGYKTYMSKGGVTLATGGFSANPELTDQYIGGWASRLAIRGSRSTTGANITLARPLNAKFVNMDQFHAGPIIASTHVNPNEVLNSGYGIIVDNRGKRFVDERNTYVIKAKACAQLTIENHAYAIVDSDCKVIDRMVKRFEMLNTPYYKADSVEELAKKISIDPKVLKKDVDDYNDALKNGTLGKMNPPCTYKQPFPIAKAPFYAIPYEGGMTATFGGPLINTKAEVQNLEGRSIPGLYAAGNAAGGLFFRDYIGGAQLGGATVFGRIAGREMAARAKAAR